MHTSSVGLMELCKPQKALEAITLGEQVHFNVFALQAQSGLWTLEEAPSMISTSRNEMLLNAFTLRELDPSLLPGVLVRWKCLFSEFRTILMHFGLKSNLARTFMSIDCLRRSEKLAQDPKAENLALVMQQHQQSQKVLLMKWGLPLMMLLSQQSPDSIQKLLEPNEAILDITFLANLPKDVNQPGNVDATGILLLILPQEKPLVEVANFNTIMKLSKEWPEMLNKVISCPPSDMPKQVKYQQEADQIGKRLRELLFPIAIESVINSGKIDCLYLCPDLNLGNLPLGLLPWADGKYLFEKCSISYLSSTREVLREWCIHTLKKSHQSKEAQSSSNETALSQERNPITNSHNTECLIIADPDFTLEIDPTEEQQDSPSLLELLMDSLGLSSQGQQKQKAEPLLKSLEEAESVKHLLSVPENGFLKPEIISGKNATLLCTLQVKSPLVLHFSTHGFSQPSGGSAYGGNFWTDMTSGLALAGINTYHSGKASKISPDAGTGELTAMAACGMDLRNTRLVYLSTCVSSLGFTTAGESVGSLAQAFRAAGAETVVAALWPVVDDAARIFAEYFYEALSKRETKPSQAVVEAKQRLRQEADYKHWIFWGPFVCIGYNFPLFMPNIFA